MSLVAAIQMSSGPDKARNLETAERLIRRAASRGAELVGLPETFSWIGPREGHAEAMETLEGPTLTTLASLAKTLGIHLLAGSIHELAEGGRSYNTSVLLSPSGDRLATYRKIHLFDVEVGGDATVRESERVLGGSELVVADTPHGCLGMSVCYDLRFPELYRALCDRGATLLAVPSAFTLTTGRDHWEVLLRARAIEAQAYVLAPAQWGSHTPGRISYGHAMVVDPWGTVLARAADGEGMAIAEIEAWRVAETRRKLPSLANRRLSVDPTVGAVVVPPARVSEADEA